MNTMAEPQGAASVPRRLIQVDVIPSSLTGGSPPPPTSHALVVCNYTCREMRVRVPNSGSEHSLYFNG